MEAFTDYRGDQRNRMDNHQITPSVLSLGGPNTMIGTGTWSGDVLHGTAEAERFGGPMWPLRLVPG